MSKSKVREPAKSSMRELFERIQHLKYAIISSNYWQLPMEFPKGKLIILTDNLQAISNVWNLTRRGMDNEFTAQLSTGQELIVTVLEKGKNVFPEPFETEILMRAIDHEGCVKVADSESFPVLRLYWKLVYEKLFADDPMERKAISEWIFRRAGTPIRTKYRWLPWDAGHIIKPEQKTTF